MPLRFAVHLAAGQGGEDAGEAQAGEDDEGYLEALHERVRVLGCHLRAPDVDGEEDGDYGHAQRHAHLAHRCYCGCGYPVQSIFDRAHNRVGVRRGEQPEAEAEERLPADDQRQRARFGYEYEEHKADDGYRHPYRCDNPGLYSVG